MESIALMRWYVSLYAPSQFHQYFTLVLKNAQIYPEASATMYYSLHKHAKHTQCLTISVYLLFKWGIVEQFLNKVDMPKQHSSAAVPLQTQSVKCITGYQQTGRKE